MCFSLPQLLTVYPRVCGGATRTLCAPFCAPGLSPRVRGSLFRDLAGNGAVRSIPACAGEPRATSASTCRSWVYPRVCGGAVPSVGRLFPGPGLSPRVRGSQLDLDVHLRRARSIPACAGEPGGGPCAGSDARVYPRVCGGAAVECREVISGEGLSPRVRGSLAAIGMLLLAIGSIPACAGEPSGTILLVASDGVYPRVCGGALFVEWEVRAFTGLSPRVRGSPRMGKRYT